MPDKKYYVQIPGTTQGMSVSAEDFEAKKDKLFNTYKDAVAVEMQDYTNGEDVGDSDFVVTIPGTTEPMQINAADFSKKKDKLFEQYPDAKVTRVRGVNYWGDKLREGEERISALKEELKGIPEEVPLSEDPRAIQGGSIAGMQKLMVEKTRQDEPNRARRGEINREIEQIKRDREQNPAWQQYWQQQDKENADARSRVDKMRQEHKKVMDEHSMDSALAAFDDDYLDIADRFYKDAKKMIDAPSKYADDNQGALGDFWQGIKDTGWNALSLVDFAQKLHEIPFLETIKTIQKNEGNDANVYDLVKNHPDRLYEMGMGDAEVEMLKAFVHKADIESGKSDLLTKSYQAGQSMAKSLGFMADFIAFGGIGDAAAEKVAGKLVESAGRRALPKLAAETFGGLVKAVAMTPLMPSSYANFIGNLEQFNDAGGVDLSGKAMLKDVGDILIENVSETIGAKPLELIGLPLQNVKFMDWAKVFRNSPVAGVLKQAGYNGFFEEMFEEWTGSALRALTGVDKDALKDFKQVDQLLITAGSFAPVALFGGTMTAAQFHSASKAMRERGAVLDGMIDNIPDEGAKAAIKEAFDNTRNIETPEDFAHAMTDVYKQIVDNGGNEEQAFKAVMDYTEAASRYKVMNGMFEEQKDVDRSQKLLEMDQQMGNANWHHYGDNGASYVRTITDEQGNERFVVAETDGELALVDREGNNSFLTEEKLNEGVTSGTLTDSGETPLFRFLDNQNESQKKQEEQVRMAAESNAAMQELQQRAQPGVEINVGTVENPIVGTIRGFQAGEYIVQMQDGSVRSYTPEAMANTMGIRLTPETDEEIEAKEIAQEVRQASLRKDINGKRNQTFVTPEGKQYTILGVTKGDAEKPFVLYVKDEEEQMEAQMLTEEELSSIASSIQPAVESVEEAAGAVQDGNPTVQVADDVPRDFRGNPLPMRTNSVTGEQEVDSNALWNEDPEAWVRWNDTNPDQDVTSDEKLDYNIDLLTKKYEEGVNATKEAALSGAEQEQIDALKAGQRETRKRLTQLEGIKAGRVNAENATNSAANNEVIEDTATPVANAAGEAPTVGVESNAEPATAEEILAAAQAALDAIDQQIAQAQNEEEYNRAIEAKAKALQQMFDALGAENTVVSTRADILDNFLEAGGSEADARKLMKSVRQTAGKERLRGFYNNGKIFIIADDIRGAEDANVTQLHEAKHLENAATGAVNEGLRTGVTEDEMRAAVFKRTGSHFYDDKSRRELVDEVLANAEEIAEKEGVEAIPQRLAEAGIVNGEFINFVQNNINNGRRGSQRRHLGGRHALQSVDSEVSGREDVRDTQPQPAAVEGQGLRPDAGGEQGAGGTAEQPAEPAGERAVDLNPVGAPLGEDVSAELREKGLVMDGGAIMDEAQDTLKQETGYKTPNERDTESDPIVSDISYSLTTIDPWARNYLTHPDAKQHVVLVMRNLAERMAADELVYGVVPKGEYKYGQKSSGSKAGPLRTNIEYIVTFDMDTSCPRSLQYLEYVKKIEAQIGRPLTMTESVQLIEMMRVYGQMIPCVYCYCENKRQALKQYYTDFMTARHGVISAKTEEEALAAMYGHKTTKEAKESNDPAVVLNDAAYRVFQQWRQEKQYNPTIRQLWSQYRNDRNVILNVLDAMLDGGQVTTNNSDEDIAQRLCEELRISDKNAQGAAADIVSEWKWNRIEDRPHDDFFTITDEDDLVVDEKTLAVWREMTLYGKSASQAKNVLRYVPYTDELKTLSQADRDYINGMGGLRMHSSNDFRIDYVLDYFQFMADMAAYRMKGHTYTKSPEFVRIFGNSGYKINMSIAAYEDSRGVRPNPDEGFDWETARQLRQQFPNAGTMLMATSDVQIQFALDNDWIDMCIPFHASGLPKAVWYNMREWTDYSSTQNERFLNGEEMRAALVADGVEIPKDAKAAEVRKMYDENFRIRTYVAQSGPKKGQRFAPHFLPGRTTQNGVNVPGHDNDYYKYIELCRQAGVHPRFYGLKVKDNTPAGGGREVDITEHPRYMIFIKETARTDTPQTPVQFNFDQPSEALGGLSPIDYAMQELQARAMAESEMAGSPVNNIYESYKQDTFGIVPKFIEGIIKHKEETGRDLPIDYLTPDSREWFMTERRAMEEAYKDFDTIPYHPHEYDADGNLIMEDEGIRTSVVGGEETQLTDAQKKALEFVNGNEETQKLFDAAKERFGTTRDIREAGYVLPDGTMLDFSGRHWLAPGSDSSYLAGDRQVDHRDIADLEYERDGNTPTGIETSMTDFIRRGAIRINDGSGASINLAVKPTPEQASVLTRLIEHNNGDVYLDLGDGERTDASTFYEGAKARRVINDIKRYFDEGVAPEGGINFSIRGILGAAEDETAMANLDTAKQMEADGKDAKTIWLATGWEKGADGKWREEIPDGTAKAVPASKKSVTVGDIIDAPELFASYPEIRDYKVNIKKTASAGAFIPSKKEIDLDKDYNFVVTVPEEKKGELHAEFLEGYGKNLNHMTAFRNKLEKKYGELKLFGPTGMKTVMHEIQHAIQSIEGFARGGNNQGQAMDYIAAATKERPELDTFTRTFSSRNSDAKLLRFGRNKMVAYLDRLIGTLDTEEKKNMASSLRDYISGLDDWGYRNFVNEAGRIWRTSRKEGEKSYNNLAGEVEARNVERRMGLTEEQRRETPISDTEDVAREEQGLRFSVADSEKIKDETLNKVNKRLEEVSRPKSDQSLTRESDPNRSENPAISSRLGAVSETKVDNKSEKTNKLLVNLADFISEVDENGVSAQDFNKRLIRAIGVKDRGQLTDYFTIDTPLGKVSMRLSSHSAHARTYRGKSNKANSNVSIVITIPGASAGKFKADRRINLVEYVYDYPQHERLVNIAKGIFNLADTGKYVDLAEADTMNESVANDDGAIRFSIANENQSIFVSNAENAVRMIQMGKATPEQWQKMIEKNGGLKAGEDKWLGLSDWLKASDRKSITKQEILDFIDQNKIRIEETRYGGSLEDDIRERIGHGKSLEELQQEIDEIRDSAARFDAIGENPSDEEMDDYLYDSMVEEYGDDFKMGYRILDGEIDYNVDPYIDEEYAETYDGPLHPINMTRLAYTTEGLGNKREIALTVPTIEPWNQSDRIHFGDAGEGRAVAWVRFGDTNVSKEKDEAERVYREAGKKYQAYKDEIANKYALKATGTKTVNDLATEEENARGNELKLDMQQKLHDWKDGQHPNQRVLFIDEIQSKRHQEGRDIGYNNKDAYKSAKVDEFRKFTVDDEEFEEADVFGRGGVRLGKITKTEDGLFYAENEDGTKVTSSRNTIEDALKAMDDAFTKEGIPAAPFEKNWHELAMKRMLRLAAEEGYDYVAWTKGEQQAERYSLSKVITGVQTARFPNEPDVRYVYLIQDGAPDIELHVNEDGVVTSVGSRYFSEYEGEKLSDIIGKELAVKTMATETDKYGNAEVVAEGEDLKIGGEGMKGFYDDILPRFVNKYAKKWGVKVEDINLPNLESNGITAHAIPVTEEMKESVMEGQLMFSVQAVEEQGNGVEYDASINAMRDAANEVAAKCGIGIEYKPSQEMQLNGKPLAGRWMNGRMYVCLEHCRDEADAVRTVLHEGVGHNGLRRLVGNENMRAFCLDMFNLLPEKDRREIASAAVNKYGGNIAEAVEEHLADKAETMDFDDDFQERSFWDVVRDGVRSLLAKVGINVPMSERDIRWLMWQSYNANKQSDILNEAKRQTVANKLGFTLRQQADVVDARQSERNRFAEQDLAPAARLYNKDVMNWMNRLHETWVDKDNSVKILVDSLEKVTGSKAKAFEDVRLALNQQSSKGLAAIEKFEREHYNPMMDAIKALMKAKGCDLKAVERYVMIKHGLERNEVFAKRDAREYYQKVHDDAVSTIRGSKTIEAEEKEKLIAKEDEKLQRRFSNIEAGTDLKYKELRNQDYGGLTAMYSEFDPIEPFQEGVESEEEYNARVLNARHPKYTFVDENGNEQVDMRATEAAAEEETSKFEEGFGKEIDELWKRINGATKATLKHQYDSNMMSRQQYLAVRDMFQYYVPLRGFAENTAGDMYDYYQSDQRNSFTPPLQKAKGRKTESESPFGYIGAMASSGIAADMKNETKLSLYYFVSNRAANDLVTISDVWYEKTGEDEDGKEVFTPVYPPLTEDLSSEEAKKAYEDWENSMKEKAKAGIAVKGTNKLDLHNSVIHIDDRQKASHVIKFKVGGRDMMMFINGNPRAAQAINNELNVEMSTDYQKVFGKVLRWFSGINTSYNPEFWLSNAQRDLLFAIMSVNVKENPEYNSAFQKNLGRLLRKTLTPGAKNGAYSLKKKLDSGELGDAKLDLLYKEFVENGAVTGYTVLKNNEEWELELRKYTGEEKKVVQGIKNAFEKVQNFGEAIEQMTRFAAYVTSREQGKDIKDSVNDAKELTVNFNRKGSGKAISFKEAEKLRTKDGKKLNAAQKAFVVGASWLPVYGRRFIMFFNAAVQGLNAMYKLAKKNPGKLAVWTAGYLTLGAMQAAAHALLDDDDDYLDIPDYERRNNLLIGGNGGYFKWALPQESRVFYAIGDMAVNHMLGREPHKSMLSEVLLAAADIAPLNPAGGVSALAPSAITPVIEVILNRDYKGSKIYNDLKYLSDEERKRTPAYQKAYTGTGKVYVAMSQFANWLSGGDYADAGWININPAAVEHIMKGATGGAGTTLGKLYRGTVGQVLGEEFMVRNTPFISRLFTVTDERYRNAHTTELFDYYKAEAEHTKKMIRTYQKNGDDKRLNRIMDSDDYEIMSIYESYRRLLEWYNDELKATTDKKDRKALMREQDAVRKDMILEISEIK